MIPWNLLLGFGSEGFKIWQKRKQKQAAMQHKMDMNITESSTVKSRRAGSLFLDLTLGLIALVPLLTIFVGAYYPPALTKLDVMVNSVSLLPKEYWYLIFIVYGGNYGISIFNNSIIKKVGK